MSSYKIRVTTKLNSEWSGTLKVNLPPGKTEKDIEIITGNELFFSDDTRILLPVNVENPNWADSYYENPENYFEIELTEKARRKK